MPRRDEVLSKIKILFLDFDGVLTDGYVYVDEYGKETARCSHRDGMGIKMIGQVGIKVVVISGQISSYVKARCKKLKIECFQGIDNKAEFLKGYFQNRQILPEEAAYVGDDVNDFSAMKIIGAPIAVGDAVSAIKEIALYVTEKNGGEGAVREVCDLILKAKKEAAK